MKILLLGEYSGFYKNLKNGLVELGHDVTLIANGDGWKKIDGADDILYNIETRPFKKIQEHIILPLCKLKKYAGYDVVQIISPNILNQYINFKILKNVIRNNERSFFSAAGDDFFYYKAYKEKIYKYFPLEGEAFVEVKYNNQSLRSKKLIFEEKKLFSLVDGIIPIVYDYAIPHKKNKNLLETIPLPLDTKSISFFENKIKNKIIFFHGLNRENFKGTYYIREALNIIKKRYPNDVEIIIDGKMPLEEYLNVMKKANVVLDQCKSYSWGVNALYAMAQGKVVMGGCEREALEHFSLDNAPIINIKPDINHIVEKLEIIIENKKHLKRMGEESRQFVENFHDYKDVSQKYVNQWKSK